MLEIGLRIVFCANPGRSSAAFHAVPLITGK
jgi:hypothetical protein